MKILMAMSGGVDSSAAAKILLDQGHEVTGAILKLHDNAEEDIASAQRIADRLNIDLHIIDRREYFSDTVEKYFVETYLAANTPSTCIFCNRYCKFKLLLDYADELGMEKVASGHYARLEYVDAPQDSKSAPADNAAGMDASNNSRGRWIVRKGVDLTKDQSYMLSYLTQDQIARLIFPLGTMTKTEIRAMAEAAGFENAHAKDSQDVCFIPDGDYGKFIEERVKENVFIEERVNERLSEKQLSEAQLPKAMRPGNIVDLEGNVLGSHKGLIHYTIGQRKGLETKLNTRIFVCEKRLDTNEVVISDNDYLNKKEVRMQHVNWIYAEPENGVTLRIKAKVRHSNSEAYAAATWNADTGIVTAVFDGTVRAPSPGQFMVLYDGDAVVAGGEILL